MPNKFVLGDCSQEELSAYVSTIGEPTYRANQLFQNIAQGLLPDEMSNLPKALRIRIAEDFLAPPIILETFSSKDGSSKILYRLHDGNLIEGVFMPHTYGVSLCLSTQVGCRMRCAFCASGIDGLARNLSAGEMLGQITAANRYFTTSPITNIVLMGSGEPLDNFEQVVKFLALATDTAGLGLSKRSISLSTCGLVERIYDLADRNPGVTLSISLHATTDEIRRELMPIAQRYTIQQVTDAARTYFQKTGRRIIYEYTLIKGKNMHYLDAKRLREITKGYSAHINLIMLNPVKEKDLQGCTSAEAMQFLKRLQNLGVSATLRKSMGSDVAGACGQLRRKRMSDPKQFT